MLSNTDLLCFLSCLKGFFSRFASAYTWTALLNIMLQNIHQWDEPPEPLRITNRAGWLSPLLCAGCHCCCVCSLLSMCKSWFISTATSCNICTSYLYRNLMQEGVHEHGYLQGKVQHQTRQEWYVCFIGHVIDDFALIIIQKGSGLDLHPLFSAKAKSRMAEHLSARKLSLKVRMMHKDCCVVIGYPVWA